MTLNTENTELRSLLSDLKEHGLLDKYPNLEEAVKRGYRHLEFLDSESMPSVTTTKPHRQIHDINKTLERVKEGLKSMPSVTTTKPHRQIHDINKTLERCKEDILKDLKNFK